MSVRAATLIGFSAIVIWASLATLTVASGTIPPFQLAAISFAIGGALGAGRWIIRPQSITTLRQPPIVWAVGLGGLFFYHALYFIALRLAPAAEASLVNYLWPLLIVLFSSLLPGEHLKPHHIIGALLGLAGTIVLLGGSVTSFHAAYLPGFGAAFLAAFVWASYSVLSRRLAHVPTDAVTGFCLATAACAALSHLAFETTIWPATALQWTAILLMGVGPVGAAFFAWDIGMKRGDIRVLGALSYATPLLATAFLIAAGYAAPSLTLVAAALTIAGGGIVAAKDLFIKRSAV
jgi:drug/metabolite transporter (DMT)-like permease